MIRKWLTRYRVIVQIFMLSIGLIFLFLPLVGHFSTEVNLVFFSLATSMMASILLSFFDFAMGTDIPTILEQKLDFNRQVYDLGLDTVHLSGGDASIFDKFPHAHSIDIMSASAHGTCQHHGKKIITAIETQGCKVRILLSDPENIIWKDKVISGGLCPASNMSHEIKETEILLRQLIDNLKRSRPVLKAGSLELRYYPIAPTTGIIIVDGNQVRYTPHLPYQHSYESPAYDVTKLRGGQLYLGYRDTFNQVWEQSKPIFKENWPISRSNHRRISAELSRDN